MSGNIRWYSCKGRADSLISVKLKTRIPIRIPMRIYLDLINTPYFIPCHWGECRFFLQVLLSTSWTSSLERVRTRRLPTNGLPVIGLSWSRNLGKNNNNKFQGFVHANIICTIVQPGRRWRRQKHWRYPRAVEQGMVGDVDTIRSGSTSDNRKILFPRVSSLARFY